MMSMFEDERKKSIKRKLIFILVVLFIVIGGKFTEIQRSYVKWNAYQTKKEEVVTKTLNKDEISQLEGKQLKLIDRYNKNERGWWKTDWLWMEILHGSDPLNDGSWFLYQHPDYDLVKVKLTVRTYKVDEKTVEFVTKGKLIKVHSKDGWKDIKSVK
jgi:hypothetical protein